MRTMDAAPHESSWFRGRAGRRYGLELLVLLLAKLVALTILYFAFIAPQPRADTSRAAMQRHLFDTPSPASSGASHDRP
jgi:hypothetical protein